MSATIACLAWRDAMNPDLDIGATARGAVHDGWTCLVLAEHLHDRDDLIAGFVRAIAGTSLLLSPAVA
ncbi:hypothetical protein [Elioraea tepidiphila]|jgi:hypothetical protein|uniref:hypothetical protein n=1 Tax=Elioraea tepidiphila TaxID=457934 RepID=UPI002FD898E8